MSSINGFRNTVTGTWLSDIDLNRELSRLTYKPNFLSVNKGLALRNKKDSQLTVNGCLDQDMSKNPTTIICK